MSTQFIYKPTETKHLFSGVQHRFVFPNGYGASVICHDGSYGGKEGLWEIAVIDLSTDEIIDAPPGRDNVLGYLTVDEVNNYLCWIQSRQQETVQMFSIRQKREIAEKVQAILRETGHPELPDSGEIEFSLHVVGAYHWSWADIRNNGAVVDPDTNPHNEAMDDRG